MALFSTDDVKQELELKTDKDDTLLETIVASVLSLVDLLTDRTWETATVTEYHSTDDYMDRIFLEQRPVTSITTLHDDPDWVYGASCLVPSRDYAFDSQRGILYYSGFFCSGKRNVKVVYVSGYSSSTVPAAYKQIMVRQACVWYKQLKGSEWHLSAKITPAGGGSVTLQSLKNNLLPEFELMLMREKN